MADNDIGKTAVLDRNIDDYSTSAQALDFNESGEVFIDFPNAAQNFGYYKKYGQLKKAIDTLWIYVVGKGYTASDSRTRVMLDHLSGWGEDTSHSIFWNLGVTSMIQGDAFAEIVRENDTTINLKMHSPERTRIVLGRNGIIKVH